MQFFNFIIKSLSNFVAFSTKKFNFVAENTIIISMVTKEEVQRFLNQMKEKIKVFGII